ncbi:MAG TPA: hypothetical protein VFA77_09505 [Candidatus Eisenbacteria bacterium]|jgi:ABC-type transport system involved in multi-copper enzyme maturation permease subunit|nr:hypothetical protein [Candidatus Eisenbacteria bacterium]
MQRICAIAGLTWKAAFRFRLFWVIAVLLLATVVGLPLVIKDDGTARGLTQILLTYTLGMITALLGLSTLWLGCGTLARDVEDCQIQMVAVKPIARWEIWLGKWLGILLLNGVLLALAGGSVYGLLQWRASRLKNEREKAILRDEIFVARASLREEATDFRPDVERIFLDRIKKVDATGADPQLLRQQIEEQVQAQWQVVPPGHYRRWEIKLGVLKDSVRGQPLFIRTKFNAAQTNAAGTYLGNWQVGPPESAKIVVREMSLSADTFHEIPIPPDLFDDNGVLTIDFINRNDTALLFTLKEGMEVLYREAGFGVNFARGLGIIFCWLSLLAALGLASATFLSFPVASFLAASILVIGLSTGTMANAVQEGTIGGYDAEKGTSGHTWADPIFIPLFKAILGLFNLVQQFSPIDSLSTGRSITWGQLGLAFTLIVILLGGILGLIGVFIFNRRELATAQPNQ